MSDDMELVSRARRGDTSSFQVLVERHQARVYTLILGMWSDPLEAEELAQDTFVLAYRSLGGFRGESGFATWLCRIAVNVCQGHRRRSYRRKNLAPQELMAPESLPEVPGERGNPESSVLDQMELRELRRHLDRLPEQHRFPLYMHYFAGQPYKDMAATLGISVKGVEARMARAREALKRSMTMGGVEVG